VRPRAASLQSRRDVFFPEKEKITGYSTVLIGEACPVGNEMNLCHGAASIASRLVRTELQTFLFFVMCDDGKLTAVPAGF
jgi:hypothetical protein